MLRTQGLNMWTSCGHEFVNLHNKGFKEYDDSNVFQVGFLFHNVMEEGGFLLSKLI